MVLHPQAQPMTAPRLQVKIDLLEDRIANVPPEDDVTVMFSQVGARGVDAALAGQGHTNTDPDLLGNMRVELVEQDTRVYSTRNLFVGLSGIPKHPKLEGIGLPAVLQRRRHRRAVDRAGRRVRPSSSRQPPCSSRPSSTASAGFLRLKTTPPLAPHSWSRASRTAARRLGFDAGSVGQQLRSWLSGSTAVNLIRDDGEISVEVKSRRSRANRQFPRRARPLHPHRRAGEAQPGGRLYRSGRLLADPVARRFAADYRAGGAG